MSDGNNAIRNRFGAIVNANSVGRFGTRMAKEKLVLLSAVSHSSVIAQ